MWEISLRLPEKNQQVSKRPSGGSKTMVRIRPSSTTAMDILHKTSSASAASKLAVLRPSTATTMDIHKFLRDLFHGSKGRLVDLGAGVRDDDPCFPFIDAGWDGLLVDGDPTQTAKWAARFPKKDAKHNIVSFITFDTLHDIIEGNGYSSNSSSSSNNDTIIDLLKIDIDSFDCFIMDNVLKIIRPRFIVMEVNVKYPPKIRFAMFPGFDENGSQIEYDSETRKHVYGCSLAYQVIDLMKPNDYEIMHLDWNNAVYYDTRAVTIHVDGESSSEHQYSPPSIDKLYESGYWQRSARKQKFSFNKEVEHWVTKGLPSEEIFTQIQKFYRSDSSHKNHHIFIGEVGDAELKHGCFDGSGRLHGATDSPDKCTATKGF